jgi:1-acyl-sn-glycerol-3-phosphate acyltransferase
MAESPSIRYPRRVIIRSAIRLFGRAAMALLTRTTITGRENLPKAGPLIVVGNHVAILEVVMMALYAPWLVEFLGAGDIPLDSRYAPFVNTYGIIPINRGSMDREGLNMALEVLQQKGVVGIFPEGGIWETTLKQGRTGVAWLSYKANVPILPMGFGGIEGALTAALTFKRPRLTMNIGTLIPPITVDGKSRKQALEDGARLVMERIDALIPEEDKLHRQHIYDERFDFTLEICDSNSTPVNLDGLRISQPEALGQFFYRPVLLNTLERNLKLPVLPLQNLDSERSPNAIEEAAQTILDYLVKNPYFLSYRFGYEAAGAMQTSLTELRDIARWAGEKNYTLRLKPSRRYRLSENGEEIVETGLAEAHRM